MAADANTAASTWLLLTGDAQEAVGLGELDPDRLFKVMQGEERSMVDTVTMHLGYTSPDPVKAQRMGGRQAEQRQRISKQPESTCSS